MALISEAKRAANRANATRSTGLRSDDGKVVRSNALKHGLCATQAVLPGEHEAAFDALHTDLLTRLRPDGDGQRQLVEQAARELWRLRRAGLSETGALAQLADPYLLQSEGDDPVQREVYVLGATLRQDFGEGGFVDKLSRYETRSGRALERALRLLERLRALSAQAGGGGNAQPPAKIGFVPSAEAPPAAAAESSPACGERKPQFTAEFGFVRQNRAALFGSVSSLALALAELTRAPEIRWPPGWARS